MKKLEFLVVTDIFMTPTAELADIVLPACTFLEKTRFVAYDPHVDHGWNVPSRIVLSQKAIEPLYESWSDWEIILIAGSKLEMYTHSMMRNIPKLREQFPENLLEINPGTAAKLSIDDGNVVTVTSPRGGIKCMAKVTDRIDPRVVHLYRGFAKSNCNVLTDHKICDPITGSTGLKSLLCKVGEV